MKLHHMQYLRSDKNVCDAPWLLGHDFITTSNDLMVDPSDGEGYCYECNDLLSRYINGDPIAPARGVLIGLLLATIFWALVAAAFKLFIL